MSSSEPSAPSRAPRWRRLLQPTLFFVYCAAYSAFVLVAAFGTFAGGAPSGGLAAQAPLGLTWGVVAGFGLILGAFALALVYAAFGAAAEESPLVGAGHESGAEAAR